MSEIDDIVRAPRRAPFVSPLQLIGTPYVRGGVSPDIGLDCYSLMAYVRWHWFGRRTPLVGIPAPAPATTAQACALGIYRALGGREHMAPAWHECEAHEGCAVALGRVRLGRLHHCGVYIEGGVLHALEQIGVAWMPAERARQVFARVEYYECTRA